MASSDIYRSIASPAEGLYKDRGSRFLAYVYPVSEESQIKPLVDALKKEHHSAHHHCFAYRLGCDASLWRANDDGEPSGTAGKPILGAIEKSGYSDVLVVVVRYFGGILLGTPALAKAYREAAAMALDSAEGVEKVRRTMLRLEFGYAEMEAVQRLVKSCDGANVTARDFGMECVMTVEIPSGDSAAFVESINLYNNEKGTCIQCRSLQTAPGSTGCRS